MNDQLKRNQRVILIVMAMSLIPFVIAWLMTKNPEWLSGRTNKGELIIPPVTTERSELKGYDRFSMDNLSELNGRWVLINVIPGKACDEICQDAIYKTRQLRLMMSKDLTRIRRVVLILDSVDPTMSSDWWKDDSRLIRARPDSTLIDKMKKIRNGRVPDGMLFVMDPLGNLMMQYEPGFDPYDVKADLKKLLQISQIG
jgi:hypothetical protein